MFFQSCVRFFLLLPTLFIFFCTAGAPVNSIPSKPLTAPALASPADGATGQNTTLKLVWDSVTAATMYDVEVSSNSAFSSVTVADSMIKGDSATVGALSASTTYYWRVQARNSASIGVWSGAWHFATAAVTAPILVSPANGANSQPATLSVSWEGVTSAASYSILLSTVSNFASTVVGLTGVTGTAASVSDLAIFTTYYWEVNATNTDSTSAWSGAWHFTVGGTKVLSMVQIPGGTFRMGSTDTDFSDEQPVHPVTVSTFYIDTTDVTQADYQALMGVNPSYFTGVPQRPVEQVTWFDAVLYCNARSRRDGYDTVYSYSSITGAPGNGCSNLGNLTMDFTHHGYRLPTEAEWEYACRAGTATDYYWGGSYPPLIASDTSTIDADAVWWHNSPDSTQPVASKLPNAWGLYDMAGNVWQWCNDWYGSYSSSAQSDPTGPSSGTYRVMRGGSWANYDYNLRSADRYVSGYAIPGGWNGDNGFRCVRR